MDGWKDRPALSTPTVTQQNKFEGLLYFGRKRAEPRVASVVVSTPLPPPHTQPPRPYFETRDRLIYDLRMVKEKRNHNLFFFGYSYAVY